MFEAPLQNKAASISSCVVRLRSLVSAPMGRLAIKRQKRAKALKVAISLARLSMSPLTESSQRGAITAFSANTFKLALLILLSLF